MHCCTPHEQVVRKMRRKKNKHANGSATRWPMRLPGGQARSTGHEPQGVDGGLCILPSIPLVRQSFLIQFAGPRHIHEVFCKNIWTAKMSAGPFCKHARSQNGRLLVCKNLRSEQQKTLGEKLLLSVTLILSALYAMD